MCILKSTFQPQQLARVWDLAAVPVSDVRVGRIGITKAEALQ